MTDQPSQEVLDQLQQSMLDTPLTSTAPDSLVQLIDEALELQGVIEGIKESLKAANERFDMLRKTLIPEAMRVAGMVDAAGHGKVSHRSGAKVHLRSELHAYVLAADKPRLMDWLRANGQQDLIKEDVHHSTLKAFCKERQEDGGALPPMVKVSPETVAVITLPKGE